MITPLAMGSINSDFTENKINGISFWMVVDIVKGHKNIDLYKFKSDSNQIIRISEGHLLQLDVFEYKKKQLLIRYWNMIINCTVMNLMVPLEMKLYNV